MEQTPKDLIRMAVEQALCMSGPLQRARAVTEILGEIQDRGPELKAARQADVLKLKETTTFSEIAEMIGVKIARIYQIAKGQS